MRAKPEPTVEQPIHRVHVEVESTSKPESGSRLHTYECDVAIRITDGDDTTVCTERLEVHHPRGWMGVRAGFEYDIDARDYPSFWTRAECARRRVLEEFPPDELVSVMLLGTGDARFDGATRA